MRDFGTVRPGTTLYIPFATYDSNDPSASVTLTGLATTDIEIYRDGSTTQRSSDAGFALLDTDGIDFDAITGIHGISIDLSDNSDAGFYRAGSQYTVVVASITVDAGTINFIAATFRIGHPSAILNTTIATLSSQTSFTLTNGPAEDDALNGMWAVIHDVASAVQWSKVLISDYTGSTKTVTLAAGATFTAAAADNFSVIDMAPIQPTTTGRTLDVSATGEADANMVQIGGDTQSATDLKDFADAGYDPATNKVQGVVLVDTVTAATLANGAHGGVAATITFERIIGVSTTTNEPAIKLTGNGTGAGLKAIGGSSGGPGIHGWGDGGEGIFGESNTSSGIAGDSTSGDGIKAVSFGASGLLIVSTNGEGLTVLSTNSTGASIQSLTVTGATTLTGAVTAISASNDIRGVQADAVKISGSTDAADNLELSAETIVVCTASGVPTTTSIPTSACTPAGSALDQFKGRIIIFRSDTATVALRGQATEITGSSASATPTFTVTALTTAPASGDTFVIV